MFDRDIASWLAPATPRSMPMLDRYLRSLSSKVVYAKQRSSHTIPLTNGLRLLSQILVSDPVTTMTYDDDPWRALGDNIDSVVRSLGRVLDPEQSGVINRHLFISPQNKCTELAFPTQREDPYGSLPMDITYTDAWKLVRPLRILENDAPDLSFEYDSGYLYYRTSSPHLVVFGIDIFAFIIKYLVYRTSLPHDVDIEYATRHYIHDEVILPCFSTDSVSLWLRNQYLQISNTNTILSSDQDGYYFGVTGNSLGSEYKPAMNDVKTLIDQLSNKTVSVRTVLSSLWLNPQGTISCRDYITDIFTNCSPPYQQQYQWMTGLAYLGWIDWFIALAYRQKNVPDVLSVKHKLKRDVTLWTYSQPWQHVNDMSCRDYIRNRVDRLLLYLDSPD